MLINDIALQAIRHRAENGTSTNQDCLDLFEFLDSNMVTEEFYIRVATAVDEAFDRIRFDPDDIVSKVLEGLKNK